MSPGVASNGLLFITGMTGHKPDGSFATAPEEQMRDAFNNVEAVLAEAGLDRSSLVDMTSYHVDLQDHFEAFKAIRDQYVVEPYPSWTAIEVSGLVAPAAIVEIKAVAEMPSGLQRLPM